MKIGVHAKMEYEKDLLFILRNDIRNSTAILLSPHRKKGRTPKPSSLWSLPWDVRESKAAHITQDDIRALEKLWSRSIPKEEKNGKSR